MHQLPPALQALSAYPQFLLWTKTADGRKLPVSAHTGEVCSAHDPQMWADAGTACAAAARSGLGLAFSFQPGNDLFFVDIDKAYRDGQWSPLACQILGMFPGAAVEVSQSGTGLHIIGRGSAPPHGCKNVPLGLEFYTQERFVALTGFNIQGDAGTDHTAALHQLAATYFPAGAGTGHDGDWSADWTEWPCEGWRGPEDDEDLIRRACNSRSANSTFGCGASFAELWAGDEAMIERAFAGDRSSADAALAQHLAFWTGNDCARMERLMRRSGLYRDKWDREDYLPRTINGRTGAVRKQTQFCQDRLPEPAQLAPTPAASPAPSAPSSAVAVAREVVGSTFLPPDDQVKLFNGCVYIQDIHRVITGTGAFLRPEQFRTTFGGYRFVLDNANEKTTTNAFEAFTESQVLRFPKANSSCFRPELPSLALIDEEGQLLLNTYVPVNTRRERGDPAPFLQLLACMLPDPRDQQIMLAYMAAVVQHPGKKFQWWPVIQGTEGNGKTSIIRILAHAVGHKYTHLPNVAKMSAASSGFNGWLRNKLFIGMEEIFVSERRDFLESFKPYVTNDRLEIEGKGADQVTGDNRANGVLCTNHKDGVPISVDTRRYAVFFTAQQSKADKIACGMTTDYFSKLYDWFKGEGAYAPYGHSYGYAVVTDYLASYQIPPELNPASGQDAPRTSSTDAAIRASLGRIEQEVLEAVEQGVPGFRNGWVSSIALNNLLERKGGRSLSPAKQRGMMATLGYDWHPGLHLGRTDNIVLPDGGKPKLYVKTGHHSVGLPTAAAVSRQYEQDQL